MQNIRRLSLIALLFCSLSGCEDSPSNEEFKTIVIDRRIGDFSDEFDLDTPTKAGITFNYLLINENEGLLAQASYSGKKYYFQPSNSPDNRRSEKQINEDLNTILKEIIVFRDSIAFLINQTADKVYNSRVFVFENDQWVNFTRRESEYASKELAVKFFFDNADKYLSELRHGNRIADVPQDMASFVRYLEENGVHPKDFILDKLENHKLLLYGDVHFRKWSWDLFRELIRDRRFVESTGVIFMELGFNCQDRINAFLAKDSLDKELLLNVFREYKLDGWDEKGKFEFITDVWRVNHKLPKAKRIKIVLIDTPRSYSEYNSLDEMREKLMPRDQRDRYMAEIIKNTLKKSKDQRNALFTVGTNHICKTLNSAGAILSEKLEDDKVYSIFTHSPRMDNRIDIPERLRHGIFDYAFQAMGNEPMAFELIDSPFGKEPFDGFYNKGNKNYQDNYDGYVFFGSLDEEPEGEILFDLYSDEFIVELNRRYAWYDSNIEDWWEIEGGSRDGLIEYLHSNQSERRWEGIIEPLKEQTKSIVNQDK